MTNLKPLCVDLDGTLIYNDMVQEALILLLKKNVLYLFLFPGWLLKGFGFFKQEIAKRITIDPSVLPYNQAMIDYIKQQRALGRKTVLATASDHRVADLIAQHLGIFDEVVASDGVHSYAGAAKLKRLQYIYADTGFDYAGNSHVDLKVWPGSGEVVIVSSEPSLLKKVKLLNKKIVHFPALKMTKKDLIHFFHFMRWRRNILIFVPLIIAHRFELNLWLYYLGAFFVFCLCSSSVAIYSDVFDIDQDRRHPKKKNRMLAAGKISVRAAMLCSLILFVASVLLGLIYSPAFSLMIVYYFLLSLLYVHLLKKQFILRLFGLVALSLMPLFAGMRVR